MQTEVKRLSLNYLRVCNVPMNKLTQNLEFGPITVTYRQSTGNPNEQDASLSFTDLREGKDMRWSNVE